MDQENSINGPRQSAILLCGDTESGAEGRSLRFYQRYISTLQEKKQGGLGANSSSGTANVGELQQNTTRK